MSAGGRRSGSGDDEDRVERFADLLGDAKPLRKGPARVDPKRVTTPRAGRRLNSEGERSSGFRWLDPNDRHRAAAEGVNDLQLLALSRGEPPPRERIDLHGMRLEPAKRALARRLEAARARDLDCVLVIHGRGQRSASGEAVLRESLPDWLTSGPSARCVLAFSQAPQQLGGLGATLVLLRRPTRGRAS